jgi:uncharacterized protein DUF4157
MQAQLGRDFSGVRVHAGPAVNEAVREVGAMAFTRGDDIVLGSDAPRPGSVDGDRLLMHELAHVVQQREACRVVDGVSAAGDAAERAAQAVAAGGSTMKAGGTVAAVQRQAVPGKEKQAVARADVQAALTDYLAKVMQEQGGQTLHNTEQVRQAVLLLFSGMPIGMAQAEAWLRGAALPGSPAEFAAQVVRFCPRRSLPRTLARSSARLSSRPRTGGQRPRARLSAQRWRTRP